MTMCDDITRVRARAAASATGTHRRTRRATDAMGRRASETRDGGRRRGKMTLALAAMASACGARGAAAAVTELRTLAGSFKFKTDLSSASNVTITSKTAHVMITEALKLSEHVAHFAAELATFDGVGSDWDDMTEDYDAWIKPWVEDNALYSNEWVRLTGNKIPVVNGNEVVVSSDPLKSYVAAAVAKAKSDAGSIDAMKEIIEKTVWDAAGYQASLKALATAQEVDSSSPKNGVCVSGPSQTDATKAHWDLGAALIIGDGYHSVLGRAQKRGFEFGTIGATGVAKAYEKIMKLLRAGQEEKTCDGPDTDMTLHEIYERIEWQMRVVYSQSILKYVYKMDMAIASGKVTAAFHDLHAEGQAMYRVIAGDVMAKAPTAGAWLNEYFRINVKRTAGSWNYANYCEARKHVVAFINTGSTHDVKESDLGTYVDAANVDCDAKTNHDPSLELKSLAGSYYPTDLTSSSDSGALARFKRAKALGANVAHIFVELAAYVLNKKSDWSDMSEDFVESYKEWTEDWTSYKSNEWDHMTKYEFPKTRASGNYPASSTPLSTYVSDAVELAKDDTRREAAKEMIEKTMMDAVGFHGALNLLSKAQALVADGGVCETGSRNDEQDGLWDAAAALLIGDGYHSVLGRAQKRGAEFGTLGSTHSAKPYEQIIQLLRQGQEETDCGQLHEIYELIEKWLRVVYSQSVIKYAYKIDTKLKSGEMSAYDDLTAEGQAMYRVIAADVKRKGATTAPDAYTFFDDLFDVRKGPTAGSWAYANYCKAIDQLTKALSSSTPSHAVTESDIGTYMHAFHVHCATQAEHGSSSSVADLFEKVHALGAPESGASKKEVRAVEALAAFSFVVGLAGLVVGSVALHKTRRGGATAFKSSYVVHNV